MTAIAFGPVPSRRLGRSLGINNIPPKSCSYACVYCQVGRTVELVAERHAFYPPEEVVRQVEKRVREVRARGDTIDYLAFVPDGEPTLDVHLGREITGLCSLGIPVAVISNGFLVGGLNDDEAHLDELARYLEALGPDVAYLSAPTRPPAETWVRPPGDDVVFRAWQFLATRLPATSVDLLIGDEGNAFATTGDARADLLAITAVHPMREEAVADLLARSGQGWPVVEELVADGRLARCEHEGRTFFVRRFARSAPVATAGATPGRVT